MTNPSRRPELSLPKGQLCLLLCISLLLLQAVPSTIAQKFEPYQLNGGLVSAVAAKDFIVIASDTRFMGEGGYDILSRDHVESRLWMAGDDSNPLSLQRSNARAADSGVHNKSPSSLKPKGATKVQAFALPQSPAFVGSAGCNADCEALKRYVQADLRSAVFFGECSATDSSNSKHPPVDQVAMLLSQMLYSRRGFPFYSFCVVAGLSHDDDNSSAGGGQVYVYDAIGSYEQVAVASSGTGRELLQPILDGKFRTIAAPEKGSAEGMAMATTVPTQVDCTPEEAVSILIDAYKSVSEREIGVGDKMVICVVKRQPNQEEGVECNVFTVPLKKH